MNESATAYEPSELLKKLVDDPEPVTVDGASVTLRYLRDSAHS